jgi:tetratricopeptide (TPR) repeat protein
LELNAASPGLGRLYAFWYLRTLGRFEEALRVLDGVLAQDPLAANNRLARAVTLFCSRRYQESEQECRRILSIDSGYVYAQHYLALSLGFQQRFEEAFQTTRRLAEESGKWHAPIAALGMVCALAGRVEQAHDIIGELQDIARTSYVPPASIAVIHAICGENDSAFEWADKAIELRDPFILPANVHPGFDRIRADPRFRGLLAKMYLA